MGLGSLSIVLIEPEKRVACRAIVSIIFLKAFDNVLLWVAEIYQDLDTISFYEWENIKSRKEEELTDDKRVVR